MMIVGWFILLTSLLSFWRVKHWERGIISSQRENAPPSATPATPQPTTINILSLLSFPGSSRSTHLHQGVGLGSARTDSREREYDRSESNDRLDLAERALMIPVGTDPATVRNAEGTLRNERQLQADLRAAGLI